MPQVLTTSQTVGAITAHLHGSLRVMTRLNAAGYIGQPRSTQATRLGIGDCIRTLSTADTTSVKNERTQDTWNAVYLLLSSLILMRPRPNYVRRRAPLEYYIR